MITCDCEVYEICPSCAPSEPVYAKAAEWHNKVMRGVQAGEKRAALEHSLAATFVKWMFSKDPAERSQLWQSMFEIARKLKELDAD